MLKEISKITVTDEKTGATEENISTNPIFMMSNSGSRGNQDQMRQLAGMRGLMAKPSGEIIEDAHHLLVPRGPVRAAVLHFHARRAQGLADTALKTANSGYLTRRLVDVVQDVIIGDDDCGTVDGLEISHLIKAGDIKTRLSERALGRFTLFPVYDTATGEELIPPNTMIDEDYADKLDTSGVSSITIRSALTCQSKRGVCSHCYGRDLARGHKVNVGEAVGIIAAQSIGEPGTQLTMRTFHIGGTASRESSATPSRPSTLAGSSCPGSRRSRTPRASSWSWARAARWASWTSRAASARSTCCPRAPSSM